jgi:transposase InsO family protein
VKVIKENSNKYSIKDMCELLNISRSLVYYQRKQKEKDFTLDNLIIKIFYDSRKNYGSRKIKKELSKQDYKVSLRKIRQIMSKYGLVSQYSVKRYRKNHDLSNNSSIINIVARKFDKRKCLEVIISDLTYVRVGEKWGYICLVIDLFNREIVGHSAGAHKNALMVESALSTIKYNLHDVEIFHSDRGSEFDNELIDDVLLKYNIQRSLSRKGNPYDNAVAEATYRIIKTEFCSNKKFADISELSRELFDFVNWYNNYRIHGSLGYLTPMEYKSLHI